MKIAHIGSYDINLGDNVALLNARRGFEKYINDIEWVSIRIQDFWEFSNKPEETIKILNKDYDCILVGGGGLIEYNDWENSHTNYKLPFNKEILSSLNCPVFFIGLGINSFRGGKEFSEEAKLSLKETIDFSTYFSLRNDGSPEALERMGLSSPKIESIPDPGLIFDYHKVRNNHSLKLNFIQPAFNGKHIINLNRYKSSKNIEKLRHFANANKLKAVAHSVKDFQVFDNFLVSASEFKKAVAFVHTNQLVQIYLNFDSVIAMRGHGQLISIGLNIPGLYLSTQDKVRDFSLLNGFENFNIDIEDENWYELLEDKYNKLTSDTNFLDDWYQIKEDKEKGWNNSFYSFIEKCVEKLQ